MTEALSNLTYLICEEADRPERVRLYASMSEECLRALTEALKEAALGEGVPVVQAKAG